MKNIDKKRIIVGLIVVSFIIGCVVLVKGCSKDDNSKPISIEKTEAIEITDPEIIKDQVVDGLKFKNRVFVIQDGVSRIITEVTNNTGTDYSIKEYNIIIKDKNGKTLATLTGYVGEVIKNKDTKIIDTSIDRDLRDVATIEYIPVK